MKPINASLPALLLILVSTNGAWAEENGFDRQGSILLAGEIIIGADRNDSAGAPSARSQRERAGAYQKGIEGALPAPEEDDGILSPRGGAPAEERAFDNRMRARTYQQGMDAPAGLPGMLPGMGVIPVPATSQERARDLRNRARSYGAGSGQGIDLSQVGPDGIPIVPCKDVDNVAARIGDDMVSGSIFYLVSNGQQIKVRCK